MKNRYFSLEKNENVATLNIYGDITSYAWEECGEVSAVNLSKQLEALGDVERIDVYINSYGGEVAEGLAIYNALRRHKAKIVTHCDGFACSIASVIFMAGDERIMSRSSLLMIHNAWSCFAGNAEEMRKEADDLEKITQASIEAYKADSSLTEDEIKALMDAETWILPDEALEYGFATAIGTGKSSVASQCAWKQLFEMIKSYQKKEDPDSDPDDEDTEDQEDPDDTKKTEDPEDPDTEDDNEDDEEEEEKLKTDEAAQKWSGFFNALLKM